MYKYTTISIMLVASVLFCYRLQTLNISESNVIKWLRYGLQSSVVWPVILATMAKALRINSLIDNRVCCWLLLFPMTFDIYFDEFNIIRKASWTTIPWHSADYHQHNDNTTNEFEKNWKQCEDKYDRKVNNKISKSHLITLSDDC